MENRLDVCREWIQKIISLNKHGRAGPRPYIAEFLSDANDLWNVMATRPEAKWHSGPLDRWFKRVKSKYDLIIVALDPTGAQKCIPSSLGTLPAADKPTVSAHIESLGLPSANFGILESFHELAAGLHATDDFHAGLRSATAACMGASTYTEDNFAFGTTPVVSVIEILKHSSVQRALNSCKCDPPGLQSAESGIVVCGSSTGTIVTALALCTGTRTRGIEILEQLNDHAVRMWKQACTVSAAIHPVAGDPLGACSVAALCDWTLGDATDEAVNYAGARLVFLTSQCWDEDLITAVYRKLGSELGAGAVVVDYGSHGYKHFSPKAITDCDPLEEVSLFREVGCVAVPVSWHERHKFHIAERVSQ